MTAMLIKSAHLLGNPEWVDVRILGGYVAEIAPALEATPDDTVCFANGHCLMPGLHDHHIHLMSFAASLASVNCGPPDVTHTQQFISQLAQLNAESPGEWLRAIGYHPSVAGDIDRHWLDDHIPDRPIRIQHRGGRLWVLNSAALSRLVDGDTVIPEGLETIDGQLTGRLYEGDGWLRQQLPPSLPNVEQASRLLARFGVVGITDTTPTNGTAEWALFRQLQSEGTLLQRCRLMGNADLNDQLNSPWLQRGEVKIHLLESKLPDWDSMVTLIRDAHNVGRNVAVHCVTLTEMIFTISAMETAGTIPGDRIEHASVCPPQQLRQLKKLDVRVVTQPHFIAERGDQYIQEVDAADQPWLYRGQGFIREGIPLAAGSDASFGGCNPWLSMAAAVKRTTRSGQQIASNEALTPEQAVGLYLSPPDQPGIHRRGVSQGDPADLCLIDRDWQQAREELANVRVRATWINGVLVHHLN